MKKILVGVLFIVALLPAYSQKVSTRVIKQAGGKSAEWFILDENYLPVFPGSSLFPADTVDFSLESEKRYYFVVSFYNSQVKQDLFSLSINDEPVILVNTSIGPGDHFIPFYTGVKMPAAKITGGTSTTISEFPWQVLVQSTDLVCGGTIIGSNWILTAAHCTKKSTGVTYSPSEMSIVAAATNPFSSQQGTRYSVIEVIPHEFYNSSTLVNDIALLRLGSNITNVNASPVKIVSQTDVSFGATDPGVMSWVTGWGLTNPAVQAFATSLQKVQLPIVSNTQASTVWRSIPITDLMAGFLSGNKDACAGDSGGPLVVPVMGEYKVAGIVSWGSPDCNTYGGYTRVSVFQDWIKAKSGIGPGTMPGIPTGDTIICKGTASTSYRVVAPGGSINPEWRISPSDAGSVTGTSTSALVTWNPAFTGTALLGYRATVNGTVTEWSRLRIHVVLNTRVTRQQNDTAVCEGQPVKLQIVTEGYNLIYQWYRNRNLVSTTNSPELKIASLTAADAGDYQVAISGPCGTVMSAVSKLTVYSLTNIISVPADVSVPFGSNYTLDVLAKGTNLSYTWYRDSVLLQTSASPSLALSNVNANDIGLYTVTVKGACGTQTSDSIYLFVEAKSGPDIFLWPSVTSEFFNVAINSDAIYNILIYNSVGQKVQEHRYLQYQTRVNISTLSKGTYIITVYNNNFRKSFRLIKI